jgi:glutaredoxin
VKVSLYTTLGCHLCEQALQLLQFARQTDQKIEIAEIEIADDDHLMAQYGIRIPVVAVSNRELGWPFDSSELNEFLYDVPQQP